MFSHVKSEEEIMEFEADDGKYVDGQVHIRMTKFTSVHHFKSISLSWFA